MYTTLQNVVEVDALNAIADNLEKNITDDMFDMSHWRIKKGEGRNCKTVGCAIGWSYELPEVKACGLHAYGSAYGGQSFTPHCDEFTDYKAIGRAFHITEHDAEYLFASEMLVPGRDLTRKGTIARIRAFTAAYAHD